MLRKNNDAEKGVIGSQSETFFSEEPCIGKMHRLIEDVAGEHYSSVCLCIICNQKNKKAEIKGRVGTVNLRNRLEIARI